jgi:hypothetical protein
MDTMNLTPQARSGQGVWIDRVQAAAAEHDRTGRALDAVIADATAAGVPAEELAAVGPCQPGHGRHAADQLAVNPTGSDPAATADTTDTTDTTDPATDSLRGPISEDAAPVVVGPLIPGELGREVLVQHGSGQPGFRLCTDQDDLAAFVASERPGTDLDDPRQVQWADRAREWVS